MNFMESGWPRNPDNSVVCILCKRLVSFIKNNPEEYFRHLITQHCAFFNLNLLLTLTLSQPTSVSTEPVIVSQNNPPMPSIASKVGNKERAQQRELHYAIKTERMESEDCPVWYPVIKQGRDKEKDKEKRTRDLPVIKMERDSDQHLKLPPAIKKERDNDHEGSHPVIKMERDA